MKAILIIISTIYFMQIYFAIVNLIYDEYKTKKEFVMSLLPFYLIHNSIKTLAVLIRKYKRLK